MGTSPPAVASRTSRRDLALLTWMVSIEKLELSSPFRCAAALFRFSSSPFGLEAIPLRWEAIATSSKGHRF